MNRIEELLGLIALELAHFRMDRGANQANGEGSNRNLVRVILAKAHSVGLAAPTMLTARLEYRYRFSNGEELTPTPNQALRIESALWADDAFADRYAKASMLGSSARVTVWINADGDYEACVVEVSQARFGWMEV